MNFLLFGAGLGQNYGTDAAIIGTEKILHRRFPGSDVWVQHLSWKSANCNAILTSGHQLVLKGAERSARLLRFFRYYCERSSLLTRKPAAVPKRLVRQAACVLSIGGDLYTFAGQERNWVWPYPMVESGDKIMRMGIPYVIWCASVGPLEKAGTRLSGIVEHLNRCRAIIVREGESYSYLRNKLGIEGNVHLAADPAFLMDPEPFEDGFLGQREGEKLLAVNFCLGPMQHVYGHQAVAEFQSRLSEVVRALLGRLRIRILLVPHLPGAHSFLCPVFNAVRSEFAGRVGVLPANLGSPKTKWAVSQANALLTMRFHCALAGFSTCTPTVVLVSTSKGRNICREMYGDVNYALDMREMTEDSIISKVEHILANESRVRDRLTPVCAKMKTRAYAAGDILAQALAADTQL